MNSFVKSNKLWLGLLSLAVVIVLLAFLFRPKPIEYQVGLEQSLNLVTDQSLVVSLADLSGKQLIDIRPADQFAQGHAELAINIPIRNLLDEESVELFDRLHANGQETVLYGSEEIQAVSPCMLLQQMGYKNVKLLKGHFSVNNQFAETPAHATEVMLLDTAAMKAKPVVPEAPKVVKKKPEVVIPVRQEVSSGGGC